MQKITRYFLKNWIGLFTLTTGIVFMLIYLVFFAMLFLQVMEHEEVTLFIVLGWVFIRTTLIMQTMLPLLFLFSIVFLVFYFEHNGELKAIYLCGKNLFNITIFLWLMAGLVILLQMTLAQQIIPDLQTKNRNLEKSYLSSSQQAQERLALIKEPYLIEFSRFDPERMELRGVQIILIDIKNYQSDWIWVEASWGYWEDGTWRLERVRALDRDHNWHKESSLEVTDIIPTANELWQRTMHQMWPYMHSSALYELIQTNNFTHREAQQLEYLLWKRFLGWFTLLILLFPIRWYDPAKKWALLRLLMTFLFSFVFTEIMNLWSTIWLEHTNMRWFVAIMIPEVSLALFLVILWFSEGRKPTAKVNRIEA